ncbi:MAG: N-methylhydantoinase [Gaiellaceae bacterium]|nr:N-methylhydantoinase [Gaiellaceae bacterium]
MSAADVKGKRDNDVSIAVDVGGTFTDVVAMRGGGVMAQLKVPSTPPTFATGIMSGITTILERGDAPASDVSFVLHGTTVATNAILERRGARAALITTKGFRDVLELRRLRRPTLFDSDWEKPASLVPRSLRFEIDERIDAHGQVLQAVDEEQLDALVRHLEELDVEAVAVCLLNSHANSAHESLVAERLRASTRLQYISVSSEISPEIKEYERTSSTVINAYLQPVVAGYIDDLIERVGGLGVSAPVKIMKSNGGLSSAASAALVPAAIVESGPAAGVVAASSIARSLGIDAAIAFDMGGTTAKASLIEGGTPLESSEYEVGAGINASRLLSGGGGYTLRFPSLDIAEVGAGGGSIIWLDALGSPHIGPHSAGSVPGPVSYGRGGTAVTVTDANAVLGYLNPHSIADGVQEMHLDAACAAFEEQVAGPLGQDVQEAAYGMYLLANSEMSKAIRSVTTERGRDPRDFALIAYGGAGPLHAVQLARDFGIRRVIIPPRSGVFSATGLLLADVTYDEARTVSASVAAGESTIAQANRVFEDLERDVLSRAIADGYPREELALERYVDARYAGQFFDLRVSVPRTTIQAAELRAIREAFDREHERTYGRASVDEDVQLINLRVRARHTRPDDDRASSANGSRPDGSASAGAGERRSAFFAEGALDTPILRREELRGTALAGPIVIEDPDTTTVVPPGATATLGALGEIQIETAS